MSAARAAILARIRAQLGPQCSQPRAAEATRATPIPPGERVERFRAVLEGVGGHVHLARGEDEARAQLCSILGPARAVILSDDARVGALAAALAPAVTRLTSGAPRAALLAADAGLTSAQWGIAETGTLVLESARERHRLASLLPPLHVALLPVARLLGDLGEALDAVRGSGAGPGSRTITLVTGPSRTADIELELVVGVHGPKLLHVILLHEP